MGETAGALAFAGEEVRHLESPRIETEASVLQLPFGVREELFTVVPIEDGSRSGGVYGTLTDRGDRTSDKVTD